MADIEQSTDSPPPDQDLVARLERRLDRERKSRREAEKLLEEKSMALFEANERLKTFVAELESEVQRRTEDLRQALARAETATEEKSAFLAIMSHEIRTPLNGVLGMAQLLSHSELTSEQKPWVQALTSSGDILLNVINDVLDHTRGEVGKLKLDEREFDLHASFQDTVALFQPLAKQKLLTLDLTWHSDLPEVAVADVGRLKQILGNLLSNAIKFTESGSITVSTRLQALKDASFVLRVEVQDTGPGIDDQDIPKLFRPYSQLTRGHGKQAPGSGLGLAICSQLVNAMGGEISVESSAGVGTKFGFSILLRLPSRRSANTLPATEIVAMRKAAIEDAALTTLSNVSVLVAEDNEINAMVLDGLLRKWLGTLEFAADGALAVAAAQRLRPDVILMDVQMPNVDGLLATKMIRALPLAKQPYIIGLTAGSADADRVACAAAGMDDFLAKPVSRDLLLIALLDVARIRSEDRNRSLPP